MQLILRDGRLWVTRKKLDFEYYQDLVIREATGEVLEMPDPDVSLARAAYPIKVATLGRPSEGSRTDEIQP